ncbi:MAG: hypothetical protein JW873_07395 [Candidatus Saganbacteria bacterium]|nr:hypothetical protein [Candidatus Saganbacteria bacterium]
MDENLAWKIVYAGALFSLLILGLAYYLMSPPETLLSAAGERDKAMRFERSQVMGRKEGKPLWRFTAAGGWAEKNQAATYLTRVTDGTLYSGGRPVITGLIAPKAKVSRQAEQIEAFGPLRARLDLGKFGGRRPANWTAVTADYIKYIPDKKTTELSGRVRLTMKNGMIEAGHLAIDHSRSTARISQEVVVHRRSARLTTSTLYYSAEAERAEVPGPLALKLNENKVRTDLKANRGAFFLDLDQPMTFDGSLEVSQGKKTAVADSGRYSRKEHRLTLAGRTRTVLAKAGALLRPGAAARLRTPELQAILQGRTVVTAGQMVFATRTGDARASGSVEVTQKGRSARADTAFYNDKKELLTLSGRVFLKEKERWLNCRQVVISIEKETFDARGVSEARFKL